MSKYIAYILFSMNFMFLLSCNDSLASNLDGYELTGAEHGKPMILKDFDETSNYYAKDVKQGNVMEKMQAYLEHDLSAATSKIDLENRKSVIDELKNSRGLCVGFSVLWAYSQYVNGVSGKEKNFNDDLDSFFRARANLANWSSSMHLTDEEQQEIHRFIANVSFLQKSSSEIFYTESKAKSQLDLEIMLDDMKRGRPKKILEHKLTCYKKQLAKVLKEIVRPNQLTFLSTSTNTGGHTMSVYQHSQTKQILFYDPGCCDGAIIVPSIEDLANAFWDASAPERFTEVIGFSGLNLADFYYRSFTFHAFTFAHQSSNVAFQPEKLTLNQDEFLKLVKRAPQLMANINRVNSSRLIQEQSDAQIIAILEDSGIPKSTKQGILKYIVGSIAMNEPVGFSESFIYGKHDLTMLSRYLLRKHKDRLLEIASEEQIEKLKKEANRSKYLKKVNNSDQGNLIDRINIIIKKPGDLLSVKELLGNYWITDEYKNELKNGKIYQDSEITLGLAYSKLVHINLQAGHFDAALAVIKNLGDQCDILPTDTMLMTWRSPEIIDFLMHNFNDRRGYCDAFGTSQLPLWKIQIQNKISTDKKERLLAQVEEIIFNRENKTPVSLQDRRALVEELLKDEKLLKFKDRMFLAAIIPGELELIKKIVDLYKVSNQEKQEIAKKPWEFSISMDSAIGCCVKSGEITSATYLLSIIEKNMDCLPVYNRIMMWNSPEIVDFLQEKYSNNTDYQDEFGNSLLPKWKYEIQLQKSKQN